MTIQTHILALGFSILGAGAGWAGPGAHGPNGEHLDAPAPQAAVASAAPRLEARSEAFELVASLHGGELSILIDRFDTNAPVLGANVEVESGAHKAVARFHADHGDYAVDDAAFVRAISLPGEHALVFTVLAGQESDLLDGTLRVTAQDAAHDHAPAWGRPSAAIGLASALALAAAGAGIYALRRRRRARKAGGLQ